jgi:hypothetical protein
MKTQGIMFLKIFALVISLTSCLESTSQSVKTTKKPAKATVKPIVKPPVKAKQTGSSFNGTYTGNQNGNPISIQLNAKDNQVNGSFLMNGQQAKINGTIKNAICSGKITEEDTNISYNFSAERSGENLYFTLLSSGQNNQSAKLILTKSASGSNPVTLKTSAGKNRNAALIGTWRNTEVISSGSGQFYSSFSTDYFLKLNADGTALIWTGKSAGGTKDVTIDAPQGGNVQKAEWYTEGKALIFVDPGTGQKEAISFYAEPSRMMLTGKNSKKVYQRVN